MMVENKKRVQIFDIAKGISIILMTISHYQFKDIYPALVSFQKIAMIIKMPLFIFISGYLFTDKLCYKMFFQSKVDSLIKPLLSFMISILLLNILLYTISTDHITIIGIFDQIKTFLRVFKFGDFMMIGAFWFIAALFFGQMVFKGALANLNLNTPTNYYFYILLSILLVFLSNVKINFYNIQHTPIFFTYLLLGFTFKKFSSQFLNGNAFFFNSKMIMFPIFFIISCCILIYFQLDIHFDMYFLIFNYHYLLLLSILGIFTVLYLSKYIEKIPFLSLVLTYCSKASFFILAYHIFIRDVYGTMFDLEAYNPILHTFLFALNIVMCCLIYKYMLKLKFARLFFFPIKAIKLTDAEIQFLQTKIISKIIPYDDLMLSLPIANSSHLSNNVRQAIVGL
ncbi:acyltransferase family protein [Flavobacterium algicola]|uniref:acyltransferase family protein n=1 Tax=Flavobacterium algicola TaxID=556529 RepID=UPI001EFC734D|nr:acyltransferase family protein [Flavobacterium algicola]MCG9792685.1 acyltransferase family protein [Flavobacterium algicola]